MTSSIEEQMRLLELALQQGKIDDKEYDLQIDALMAFANERK